MNKNREVLPVPFFVMLVQTVATVALLKLSQSSGFIRMKPYREIFAVAAHGCLGHPAALNLRALTRLNPETLIVFRTATPRVTLGDGDVEEVHVARDRVHRHDPHRQFRVRVVRRAVRRRGVHVGESVWPPWSRPCSTSSTRFP